MASDLTYDDMATNVPHLATADAAQQTIILGYINQAELMDGLRANYSSTVPEKSTIAPADLAVLLYAGHLYELYLRSLASGGPGLIPTGQVAGFADDKRQLSFHKAQGGGLEEQQLAATLSGQMLNQLSRQRPSGGMGAMVIC